MRRRPRSSKPCSRPTPTTASGPRSPARARRQTRPRARTTCGSSIRWTAPPISSTASRSYCVSIALMVGNKLEQAVIYDPSRNDLFCATKGRGAYMNDRRIRVAKRTSLRDCLISTGFPFRPGRRLSRPTCRCWATLMPRCAGVRRPGSAALDLAYVAAGFSDGFFEMGLSPWDVAAGALLVTEAGGLVGNLHRRVGFHGTARMPGRQPQDLWPAGRHDRQVQQVRQRRRQGRGAPGSVRCTCGPATDKPADDDFPPTVHVAPF